MEEHVSGLTHLVNHYFGGLALALLHALHIQPDNVELPIPEQVVMSLVVLVLGTVLVLWLRTKLSVEKPGGAQQMAELLLKNPLGFGIQDLLEENTGHEAARYLPLVGSVSVFILFSNLLGLFPLFSFPTGQLTVPLACAILTFVYFNWHGVRHHGVGGYLGHFAGSIWWLSPLMFPVEIISTCARVLSLTVRLWANIFASDLLYVIFLSLLVPPMMAGWSKSPVLGMIVAVFPATIPLAFLGLHMFVAIIQTYVFTLLPAIYLGMATADEH
ncbi:MAG: F0F1 ATP synthase subunit A [Acidobacteriia bacterium]|nr:F0F1 ATP synthase subunit A [Terriglobia bacterium]